MQTTIPAPEQATTEQPAHFVMTPLTAAALALGLPVEDVAAYALGSRPLDLGRWV